MTAHKRSRESAGLLLYRERAGELEVFLVHPGGPYFARKDAGVWSIPKGELDPDEDALACAIREFGEEVGVLPNAAEYVALGSAQLRGGKTVHAWAFRGLEPPSELSSNTFEIEWPPKSGKRARFPEVDRGGFFALDAARVKLNPAQHAFLERLSLIHARG